MRLEFKKVDNLDPVCEKIEKFNCACAHMVTSRWAYSQTVLAGTAMRSVHASDWSVWL